MRKVNQRYHQVRPANGGGVRQLSIPANSDVASIIQRGKQVFDLDGFLQLGKPTGNIISEFTDQHGNICGYSEYLKENGLFPSKTKFYILTMADPPKMTETQRRETEEMVKSASIPEPILPSEKFEVESVEPNNLQSRYARIKESLYSSKVSEFSCSGRQACYAATRHETQGEENMPDSYLPFDSGFYLKSVTVNGKEYIDEDEILEPARKRKKTDCLIKFGPNEIHGIEDGELVLGVIPLEKGTKVTWFCDSEELVTITDGLLTYPSKPGIYKCWVEKGPLSTESSPVVVVGKSNHDFDQEAETHANDHDALSEQSDVDVSNRSRKIKFSNSLPGTAAHDSPQIHNVHEISANDVKREKEIGRGTFGVVYRGEWCGTTVAIKVFKKKTLRYMKRSTNEGILNEIDIHKKLTHPNIVQLMGVIYTPERFEISLVSEYVEGSDMESVIFEGNEVLSMKDKLSIALQTAQGLAYMHAVGVVHQDIKPANVLISRHKTAKLCDMGISRLQQSSGVTQACANGPVVGTPVFMAPEVLLDGRKPNIKSDIWSLGGTFVEWFTQKPLWGETADDSIRVISDQLKRGSLPPSLKALKPMVKNIISQCLVYQALKRPAALEIIKMFKKLCKSS